MVDAAQLQAVLKEKLQADPVNVVDTSNGCGQCFEVEIVSSLFEGKSLLQRHRLVNEAAKQEIGQLHAFSQKCWTPQQYQQQQQQQ